MPSSHGTQTLSLVLSATVTLVLGLYAWRRRGAHRAAIDSGSTFSPTLPVESGGSPA